MQNVIYPQKFVGLSQNSNKIHIICRKYPKDITIPELKFTRFIVDRNKTLGEFKMGIYNLLDKQLAEMNPNEKKKYNIRESSFVFYLTTETKIAPKFNSTMGEIFDMYSNVSDKCLYLYYHNESVLG